MAHAQQASGPPADSLAFFYQNPQPERLVEIFTDVQNRALPWGAYPPLTGLLAGDFKLHPEHIDLLVPNVKDVKAAYAVIAAARLRGCPARPPRPKRFGLSSRISGPIQRSMPSSPVFRPASKI
jgi:hypothetical protein